MQPAGGVGQASGEQRGVEDVRPVERLLLGEQVEQQGGQTRPVQRARDEPVARTVPAAAAAVGEHHDPRRPLRYGQLAAEPYRPCVHDHFRIVGPRRNGPSGQPRGGVGWPVTGHPDGGLVQAGDHLGVGGLCEVLVELADPVELPGRRQRHPLVRRVRQPAGPVRRGDGDGEHHAGRALVPGDQTCRQRGRAGRDPVVHHDRRTAGELSAGPVTAVPPCPSVELDPLPRLHLGEVLLGGPGCPHHRVVDDAHPALADRAHAQLGLERHAELAHHDHVQRGVQHLRDLGRHRNTAAGKPEDDHLAAREVPDPLGEAPPRVYTIDEVHDPPLPGSRPDPDPAPGRRFPRSSCRRTRASDRAGAPRPSPDSRTDAGRRGRTCRGGGGGGA